MHVNNYGPIPGVKECRDNPGLKDYRGRLKAPIWY